MKCGVEIPWLCVKAQADDISHETLPTNFNLHHPTIAKKTFSLLNTGK
jgi:hypothetical protein